MSTLARIVPLSVIAPPAVESLLDRAFGADRHARTAYRVRDGVSWLPALSFAAVEGDLLTGTIQCWPVALTSDGGGVHRLAMVGPVAVEPVRHGERIGTALMVALLDAAARSPEGEAMMLIGDPEYYGRFGFTVDSTADWRLPGPVERHRLLARGPAVPTGAGLLGPRLHVTA